MALPGQVILVDDDQAILDLQLETLSGMSLEAQSFSDPFAAWERIQKNGVRLVVTDWEMPGMTGMELLFKTRGLPIPPYVILLTGRGSVDRAVAAMTCGAYSFLEKPFDPQRYRELIHSGFYDARNGNASARVTSPGATAGAPLARSREMREVLDLASSAAAGESTVLLLGESGTGKEVLTTYLHAHSPRSKGPLVKVNCGALPEHLLESELFGHEKGAFTGADHRRIGRFEQADGGTLFLDEIGDLLPSLQVKLLRVLQERVIERLGSNTSIPVNFRLVCATHQDLPAAVKAGTFREDLYYRIAVVPIRLPALRERLEDTEPLARKFFEELRGKLPSGPLSLSDAALQCLRRFSWPGNVRQLRNAIEFALVVCKGPAVLPEHLPLEIRGAGPGPLRTPANGVADAGAASGEAGFPDSPVERIDAGNGLDGALQQMEAQAIRTALERHQWKIEEVISELKISRSRLYERTKAYGIRRP